MDQPFTTVGSGDAVMPGQMPMELPQQPQADENAVSNSSPHIAQLYMQHNSNGSSLRLDQSGTKEGANAKVAIPRQRSTAVPRWGGRVPRACETCRARKTKCSGDTPVCRQCKELRATCRYPMSWRERTKGYVWAVSRVCVRV
jgi:hypothetical protein